MSIVSQFEDAAREMADEVTKPRPLGEEEVQDIQITLKSDANPMSVRELRVCNCQVISAAGTFYISSIEERASPCISLVTIFLTA